MSSPESVSSRIASLGSSTRHLENLVALLFAAREARVHGAVHEPLVRHLQKRHLLLDQARKSKASSSGRPRCLRMLFSAVPQEIQVADAGDLHRVLERHEDARGGAFLRLQTQQILAVIGHLARRDFIGLPAGQHLGQRALARAVGPHDGVHLAGPDLRSIPFRISCWPALACRFVIVSIPVYPTLPSRLIPSSFCASTANSIGSSWKTSLQNPLTIIETASSVEMPRWRQ